MSQALDADKVEHGEPNSFQLITKLLRVMEVGRSEPMRSILGIAVLASGQVLFDDSPEVCVEQKAPSQTVEERGEPADCGHGHHAPISNDPVRLSQSLEAVRAIGQMVEGAEEEDHVESILG